MDDGARRAAAGFAQRHGVAVERARGAGRLPRRRGARAAAARRCCPSRSTRVVRGLTFAKTMRWDDSGLRFPRPVRWRAAPSSTPRRSSASTTRTATASPPSPSRCRTRRGVRRDACAPRDVEPDRRTRAGAIVAGARRARRLERPERRARRGRLPGRVAPVVIDGRVRRALSSQLPRRRHRDRDPAAASSATSRSGRTASRSSRTAATRTSVRGGNEQVRRRAASTTRAFTFERDVKVGHRRSRGAARRDHVLRRRRDATPTRRSGLRSSSRRSVVERRRSRRRGWPRRIRRPSSCASSRSSRVTIGAEYARLAGYPEAVCGCDRRAVPAGLRRTRRCPQTEAGRVALGGGQDRHAERLVRARAHARPARAIRTGSGAPRSASAGSRPRAC